ncbi:MAG: UvrD-helicase domain-containing protein [Clostridiales bacterium]|nr:UvrD-helicase domain-containing protein [Clostridiales bacterium]
MSDNKISFSAEQEHTITTGIDNILVSAAAGSGKTTVLVERIIRSIVSGQLSVDKLLVVTFTNDAADNMARKIEDALRERMDEAAGSGNKDLADMLSEQLDLLPNAYIQTIDSFCSRVLKEKGYLVGFDETADVFSSGNVILDENNLNLILGRAAELAVMEMYSTEGDEDSAFIKLTRRYGNGRTDDGLISGIMNVYSALRSIPDYCDVIDKCVADRKRVDASGEVPALKRFIADCKTAFEMILPGIDGMEEYCSSADSYPIKAAKKGMIGNVDKDDAVPMLFDGFRTYAGNVVNALNDDKLSDKDKYDAIKSVDPVSDVMKAGILKGLTKIKGKDADPDSVALAKACAPVGAIMDLVKNILPDRKVPTNYTVFADNFLLPENYKNVLIQTYDEHYRMQCDNTVVIEAFVQLLKLCDKHYAQLKAAVHGSDFADQEYGAYEVLKNAEAAQYYREKFTEIYIDEYQDNSALQDAIIGCFARDEGNVFRVGDIKQSIYKFRNADPDMFNGHLTKLKTVPKEEKGELCLLTENHRSSIEILDLVNFIFGQLMTEEGAEIEYDHTQRLNPAKESKHSDIPRVVVVDRMADFWDGFTAVFEADDEDSEQDGSESADGKIGREEKAGRLALSLDFGVYEEVKRYLDADPEHKVEDICVLTKTVSKSKNIASFLKQNGINAISENRTKVFEDMDIQSVISLIIVLGNEYRDEYLMSVLLRNFRFTNFDLDDLAAVNVFIKNNCKEYQNANLMVRIRVFCERSEGCDLKTRLNRFLDVFDDLRMTCRIGDIDDLVDRIYSESGVMANVLSESNFGAAKLVLLKDWLSGNFKRYGTDIGTVAMRLEEMKHNINSDARFSSRDVGDKAVTCMSIHKSKGLEFPFVILVFDDGAENGDKAGNILFDKKAGFIAADFDDELVSMNKSAERIMYDNDKSIADNAEELRLLYVALTRGERYLSVVTAADYGDRDGMKFISEALKRSALNGEDTFDRSHWLNGTKKLGYAFMSAVCRASCASDLRSRIGYGDEEFAKIIDYSGFEVEMIGTDKLTEIASSLPAGSGNAPTSTIKTSKTVKDYGEYSDKKAITIPFKVSVTGINDWDIDSSTHVDLRIKEKEEYLDRLSGKITASGKGTIVHLIMQWADPDVYINGKDALLQNVSELMDLEVFRKYDKSDVLAVAEEFAEGIIGFAKTDVGIALNNADKAGKAEFEKPIVFAVPSHDKAAPDDFVLIQGIIDSIYEESDGSVIVDYKTDNYGKVSDDEVRMKAKDKHSFQIGCYAASCEASGIHIKSKYLYLVRYGLLVEV